MSNTALVTGASSGIGAALAREHASRGGDLVLVARSKDKLQALADELAAAHRIRTMVLAEDLEAVGAAERVFAATEEAGMAIDVLVNNAGFGGHGKFHEQELAQIQGMMQLNMHALTTLTRLYLPAMVARGSGRVLNVASTAGFMPGPLQAVYYATKAYVVSLSQAISEELTGTGVTVTALCPGPVATGFVARGDLEGISLFDRAASAESVAAFGYKAMERGQLIAVNDASVGFLVNWIVPFLPRKIMLKASRQSMEKSK